MAAKKTIKQTIILPDITTRLVIIVFFIILLFFLYGIIDESKLSYFQNQCFYNLKLPFNNLFIFNHKLSFPPYFIYYLLIISAICTILFKFYSKLVPSNYTIKFSKIEKRVIKTSLSFGDNILYFVFIFLLFIHIILLNLFLREKLFIIQLLLFSVEIIFFLLIALKSDNKNKINSFKLQYLTGNEIKTLLLFFLFILILYIFDLKSWKYSYIEDEWPFFDFIKGNLSEINKINFFSGSGVYGYHPVLSSMWQAIIMFFTDKSILGWKLSSAIIIPISIIPFFLWNKMVFNKTVAIIATVVFAFSNAMLGFAHTGYNNIQSIFLYVAVLCCLELAVRKKSYFWFFASGLLAGMGFYTFYTARIIILIAVVYLLLHPQRKQITKSHIILSSLIYLLVISPAVLEKNFLKMLLTQSMIAGSEIKNPDERIIYIILNFIHSFFAFLYKYKNTHYIIDGLIDIFSAIGAIFGFIWIACSFMKDWRARFLAINYLVLVFFIGALQQYDYPVNTRLYFFVPLLATIAGTGFSRLSILSIYFKKSKKIHLLVLFLFCVIIIFNNLYTFYIKMPKKFHFSQQAYIMKILQKYKNKQIILNVYNISNFRRIIEFYEPKNKIVYSDLNTFENLLKDDTVKNSIVVFDNYSADKIMKIENHIKPDYITDNLNKRTLFFIFDFTKNVDCYSRFYKLWIVEN